MNNRLRVAGMAAIILSGLSAKAVQDGTYTFQSTDGNTQLNGSWVQFLNGSIVNWDLMDPAGVAGNQWFLNTYGSGYATYFPDLTPNNSSVVTQSTYPNSPINGNGPDAFSFSVASPQWATASSSTWFWYFEGQNNLNSSSALYDGLTYNRQTVFNDDPVGVWEYSSTQSVPDASSSLGMMAVALAALGACKQGWRFKTARQA